MRLLKAFPLLVVAVVGLAPLHLSAQTKWNLDKADLELFKGDDVEEKEFKLVGKVITRDEEDDEGNVVKKAFLEDDDGGLIPLPCEKKDKDRGVAKKLGDKALGGKDSCFNFVGQKVEIIGQGQSVLRKGKRYGKLAKITGIGPF